MPTTGSIYTLTDPRDGTIRYVGKTTKHLSERLAGHLASPTNPAMRLWINMLTAQRLVPTITLVATAPEATLGATEERQIWKHAKDGHRLFNAPYYHQHLRDLTAAPQSQSAARQDPLRSVYEKQYGTIAHARAAGRVSLPWTILVVAVRALVVVAYMLCRLRLVRIAGAATLVGTYLADVGFGRLVKEQIAPRLPVDQTVAFWQAYLAGPLSTIGIHVLVVMYLHALGGYAGVWRELPKRAPRRTSRERDAVDIAAAAALDLDRAMGSGRL